MTLLHHQKTIGIITILSGILAAACIIAGMIAVNYNSDAFSDPMLILTIPNVNAGAARWSMIFDMLGYYLLLAPVIYLLHDWIKTKTPWSNLITCSGVGYVLIGGIGAAILAVVWPYILQTYPTAAPDLQLILKTNFGFFNDMVYKGLWNLLEMFFAGTWWLWVGVIFYKNKFTYTGLLSIVLGTAGLADGVAGIFQLNALHEITLNVYLILAIIWAVCIGVFLLRKPLK